MVSSLRDGQWRWVMLPSVRMPRLRAPSWTVMNWRELALTWAQQVDFSWWQDSQKVQIERCMLRSLRCANDWFKLLVYLLFHMILHCCELIYTCLWHVFRYRTADTCCCQACLTDERLCGIWKSGKWCVFWVIFVFLSLNPLSWMEFEVHWDLDNFPPGEIWQIWVELVDLLSCSYHLLILQKAYSDSYLYIFFHLQPQPHNLMFPILEWTKLWTFQVSRWLRTVCSSPTCSVHSRELH